MTSQTNVSHAPQRGWPARKRCQHPPLRRLIELLVRTIDIGVAQLIEPTDLLLSGKEVVHVGAQVFRSRVHERANLTLGEGRVDKRRSQTTVLARIVASLAHLGNHDVGLAFRYELVDLLVLIVDDNRRIGEPLPCELLVGSTGVLHHAYARLVDVVECAVTCPHPRRA